MKNKLLLFTLISIYLVSCKDKQVIKDNAYEFEGTYSYTLGYSERPLIKITKNIDKARMITDTTLLDSLVVSYNVISLSKSTGIIRFNFKKTDTSDYPIAVAAIDVPRVPIKILSYETE